jgi:hypothetical protein
MKVNVFGGRPLNLDHHLYMADPSNRGLFFVLVLVSLPTSTKLPEPAVLVVISDIAGLAQPAPGTRL